MKTWGFPDDAVIKNPPANAGDSRHGFDPWVGKIRWSRKWQPTPVFLPGKFHGQRSLAGYSSWGCKDSDMTEHTHIDTQMKGSQLLKVLLGIHEKLPSLFFWSHDGKIL